MVSVIIFLGSPGSGKGTQASKLSDIFGYEHISIGDMLRKNVEEKFSRKFLKKIEQKK